MYVANTIISVLRDLVVTLSRDAPIVEMVDPLKSIGGMEVEMATASIFEKKASI